MQRRNLLVVAGVAAVFAIAPGQAGAVPVGDYSCDIASLQVQEEFDNGKSGPAYLTLTGTLTITPSGSPSASTGGTFLAN